MPERTTPIAPVDTHWRARLAEVQDLLLVAHDVDGLVRALLQLTNVLKDDWGARDQPLLLQLVREAYEAIEAMREQRETEIDLRDWLRAAEPFVRS